jgi:uncharacterized protein (DUF2384 family)
MKRINYEMPDPDNLLGRVNEPEVMYLSNATLDIFPISSFNLLSEKLLFTQAEWASELHISDRTLQRYLKENKAFEGLFAEHLYQMEQLADLGLLVFGDVKALDTWLRSPRDVLGKLLDFSTSSSFWGVRLLCNELGRIEYGVYK